MKRLLLSAVLLSSIGAYAQVGVNTTDPKASFEVAYDATQGDKVQAIGLPQVSNAQKANFKAENLQGGQMIWNTDKKCIEVYKGQSEGKAQWDCLTGKTSSTDTGGQPQTGEGTVSGSGNGAALASAKGYVVAMNYEGAIIDGIITTEGVKVKIPYSGGSGTYNAAIVTSTSMADAATNEQSMPFTLEVEGGTYNSSNSYMTAVIKPSSTYDAKKLTKPGDEKEIVSFKLKTNGQSEPVTITLKSIAGILDKKFKTSADHKFVYLPVRVTGTVGEQPYDETWLNFNLGADYANMNKRDEGLFKPTKVVDSKTDHHAYGSLFRFGRDSDGHELVNWKGPKKGTRAKDDISWNSDEYYEYSEKLDPCPDGYRIPSKADWVKFHKLVTGRDSESRTSKMWNEHKLSLPAAGELLDYETMFNQTSSKGFYMTTDEGLADNIYALTFDRAFSNPLVFDRNRRYGTSIRCIMDKP